MNTKNEKTELLEGALTETILGAAFAVSNGLGSGFLEKVYENVLTVELRRRRMPFEQQRSFQIHYDGIVVGQYVADLVVDGRVIVEVKAAKQLDSVHDAQLLNYLRATGLRVGLLLNFGRPKLQYKRLVL